MLSTTSLKKQISSSSRLLFALALSLCWLTPGFADDREAEATELRHQVRILQALQELDIVLVAIRDHVRPTDNLERLLEQPGTGTMARRAIQAAQLLTKEMQSAPSWLTRGQGGVKAARLLAAGADLPIRFVRAVLREEVSSGSEKLEDMAQILKDMRILLGGALKVNPVIDTYLGLLEKAIQNIAESAKVIEAATEKTNEAIREAKETIGRTEDLAKEAQPHPLDPAIAKAEARLAELERELRAQKYAEVEAAEKHCAEQRKTTLDIVSQRRRLRVRVHRAIAELEASAAGLEFQRMLLEHQIAQLKRELPPLRATAKAGTKASLKAQSQVNRKEGLLKTYQSELASLKGAAPKLVVALRRRWAKLRQLDAGLKRFLTRFDHCVARQLQEAKHATPDFLITRFPRYAVKPPPRPKASATPHACKFGPSSTSSQFYGSTDGWTSEGDAENPKAHRGYISAKDLGEGTYWKFQAPAKFLGDRSSSYGHALVFDLCQLVRGASSFNLAVVHIDDGVTGLYYDPSPDPPAKGWTRFTVCLHESHSWFKSEGGKRATAEELKRVLGRLKRLRIQGEYSNGWDVGGLRRVILFKE